MHRLVALLYCVQGHRSDVYKPRSSAYTAWTAITGQFLDNSLQRAIYAQQEFHSLF